MIDYKDVQLHSEHKYGNHDSPREQPVEFTDAAGLTTLDIWKIFDSLQYLQVCKLEQQ